MQLVHQDPAPAGDDRDFAGAGLAVAPRILARPVDVELMMRIFDGRDLEPTTEQNWNDFGYQRCLACSTPAGETDHAHGRSIGQWLGHRFRRYHRPAGGETEVK